MLLTLKRNLIKNLFLNIALFQKNVLRGFHFQTKFKQAKFVNVVKGKILDVVIDLRKIQKHLAKFLRLYYLKKMLLDYLYLLDLHMLIIAMKKKI